MASDEARVYLILTIPLEGTPGIVDNVADVVSVPIEAVGLGKLFFVSRVLQLTEKHEIEIRESAKINTLEGNR